MKKQIAIAISALFMSGVALATPPSAATLTAGALGAANVTAAVNGSSSAGLAGGNSQSGAQSLQSATVGVYSNTQVPGGNINGAQNAASGANGYTNSQGYAYNLSTGAASGAAAMTGSAYQAAVGKESTTAVVYPTSNGSVTVPSGSGAGAENSGTSQFINAGTNQGASVGAASAGNFGSQVGFTTNSTNVNLPDGTTPSANSTVNLVAGATGGTSSVTSTTNGVYQNGNQIVFGGNSNKVTDTTSSSTQIGIIGYTPFFHLPIYGPVTVTTTTPNVGNTASGSFTANAAIGGTVATGNTQGLNVSTPLN